MYIRILSRSHHELTQAARATRTARFSVGMLLALGTLLGGCNVYDSSLLRNLHPALERAGIAVDAGPLGCDANDEFGCQDAQPAFTTMRPGCDVESPDRESCALMAPNGAGQTDQEQADQDAGQAAFSDQCPNDPDKASPGACGCGQPDLDSDLDGTADCQDGCPRDANKTAAGMCGCGMSESDSDGDGCVDCVDACPRDANKTAVGACGCGKPDMDADADGTADCVDACPQDPLKTSAGLCGCGRRDPENPAQGELDCVKPWLVHRYSFDSSGDTAVDSVGSADGKIMGGSDSSQSAGALVLSGDHGRGYSGECYVALPSDGWPGGDSATFEAWITWYGASNSGGSNWQRVFDLGDQVSGAAHSYLYLTPNGNGGVRVALTSNGVSEEAYVVTAQALPLRVLKHLAVVVDGQASSLELYIDGISQGSARLRGGLSSINPMNLWLGRSNTVADPEFFGSLSEFRIYAAALTAAQLHASFNAGPDYAFAP
jgi:hypothetical protein